MAKKPEKKEVILPTETVADMLPRMVEELYGNVIANVGAFLTNKEKSGIPPSKRNTDGRMLTYAQVENLAYKLVIAQAARFYGQVTGAAIHRETKDMKSLNRSTQIRGAEDHMSNLAQELRQHMLIGMHETIDALYQQDIAETIASMGKPN